jgi:hypothetical protein
VFLPALTLSREPVLANPSFEGGNWHRAYYWNASGGPYWHTFDEVNPPADWTAFWFEGYKCPDTTGSIRIPRSHPEPVEGYITGRPEVTTIHRIMDPERIRTGDQAAKYFTFWRCQYAGIMQPVQVPVSGLYIASAWVHAWYSNCSTRPHDPPLNYNCSSRIPENLEIQIGLDPTAGFDPRAKSIVWSEPIAQYGEFAQISTPPTRLGHTATLFIISRSPLPLKHEDVYIDDVTLQYRGDKGEWTPKTSRKDCSPASTSLLKLTPAVNLAGSASTLACATSTES